MGPEATLFKRVGFAASMDKPEASITGLQSRIGFAAAMQKYEDELAAIVTSPKKRQTRRQHSAQPNHAWPDVRVSRRIDMTSVDAQWRKFHRTFEVRQGKRVGRVVALKELECVYISPSEMNDALTERYVGPSKKALDSERTRKSRNVVRQMNNFQAELGGQYDQTVKQQALAESADLRLRSQDPDNELWQARTGLTGLEQFMDPEYLRDNGLEYAIEQVLLTKSDRLWVPGRFAIEAEDGCGPRAYGFTLEDEQGIMATERQELVSGFCSRFKLNPKHFDTDWTPQVVLVDTSPHNVADLSDIVIQALPISLPLQAPRAFVAA
jgi:hypothetical protein